MSREIRRVPSDWQHPKSAGHYVPLFDETHAEAMAEYRKDPADYDNEPPDGHCYRPDFGDTALAYQVYESVSEGTPVSPVFETAEEMVGWLMNDGSGLGIGGRQMPLTREQAESFVRNAYAPSMVYSNATGLVSGLELP